MNPIIDQAVKRIHGFYRDGRTKATVVEIKLISDVFSQTKVEMVERITKLLFEMKVNLTEWTDAEFRANYAEEVIQSLSKDKDWEMLHDAKDQKKDFEERRGI